VLEEEKEEHPRVSTQQLPVAVRDANVTVEDMVPAQENSSFFYCSTLLLFLILC
jgi:hypothetical protein